MYEIACLLCRCIKKRKNNKLVFHSDYLHGLHALQLVIRVLPTACRENTPNHGARRKIPYHKRKLCTYMLKVLHIQIHDIWRTCEFHLLCPNSRKAYWLFSLRGVSNNTLREVQPIDTIIRVSYQDLLASNLIKLDL